MEKRNVYWAGELFNLKDLVGNRMLADAFERAAAGRWHAVLPQESESNAERAADIRDDDLEHLFSSDAVIVNFDGTELDSGTVAEFCFAKFLDLPAVLLRTDYRAGGESGCASDPWNLMCSGYPRTEVLLYHAMKDLHKMDFPNMMTKLGERLAETLDRCACMKPVYPDSDTAFSAFRNAVYAAGGTMPQRFPDDRIRSILQSRK